MATKKKIQKKVKKTAVKKPARKSAKKTVRKSAKRLSAAKKPKAYASKKSSKRPTKKAAKRLSAAKKPKAYVAKKAVKKLTKKPAKKSLKKPAKRIAKKVAKRLNAAKKPAKKTIAKKVIKRVPPRIVKKVPPLALKPAEEVYRPVDTAKVVAFAMSIASEMKKSAAAADKAKDLEAIRLTRRPTTRSQGKSTVKFPASDLREFRKRLLEARVRATNGVDALKATGFNESDDHEADGGDGTNQTLRLQALGQVGSINRVIQQIDEALHRIDDGTYGVCTSCGQLIRKPRLINQPFVLTCMECQSAMERGIK